MNWLFILSFLILYVIGGRKIAVPYGVALTGNPWIIILLTFIADFLQIPLFYFLYTTGGKIILFRKIMIDARSGKEKIKRYSIWNWVKRLGTSGIFIVSMLPSFGGGVWTAVLLAFVMKTEKKISYFLIMLGSLTGIALLAFLSHGIIQSIISLIR